jgi:hypothetical protein
MNTNQEKRINLRDIEKIIDENPIIKKVIYIAVFFGAIYVAGKFANGMATAVRGFKNLSSAFKGH